MILDTLEKYEQAAGAQRGQGARNLRSHCGITQIGEDKSTREAPTHRDRQSQGTTDPTGGGGNCGHLQMATASWSIRAPTKIKENMTHSMEGAPRLALASRSTCHASSSSSSSLAAFLARHRVRGPDENTRKKHLPSARARHLEQKLALLVDRADHRSL